MTSIITEAEFEKALKSLPPDRARAAIKTLSLFMEEPTLPRFNFRALKGLEGYFIINVKHGDRIILNKIDDDTYIASDIGPHDNIYRRWNRK